MEAMEEHGEGAATPVSRARRPRLAPIVAVLVLAMSGTAGALTGKNTVGSGDIKNGHVRSEDIRDGAVTSQDIGRRRSALPTSPTGR